ncbi:unnamed protein product [Closterium sp. NIES-54]
MYITLYYLVTRLPDSLASVRDHFLTLCPTELTVKLLEERLAAVEKSILAVGASRGDRRTPFFEGCSPIPLLPSIASATAVDLVGAEEVGVAFAPSGRRRNSKGKGSKGSGGDGGGGGGGGGGDGGGGGGGGGGAGIGGFNGSGGGGGGSSGGGGGSDSGGGGSGSGGGGGGSGGAGRGAAAQRGGFGGSQRQQQPHSRETPSAQQLRDWYAGHGRSGGAGPCTYVLHTGGRREETCSLPHTAQNVAIFDLDFDAILAAMYALTDSAEGDCYLSVPPDPGIEAAALGASASAAPGTSESAAPGAGESALSGTAPTEALHTFTLDSGAMRSFFHDSTTLTQLSRPVAVSLADPSGGPVLAHSSTVLPCPAAPSGLLSGLHLPSFSTNLVSGADLQDAWVDQFTPGGQRVTHCTCSRMGRHLATFTRRPGSSLYTLTTASPPVSASGQVAASCQVFAAASRSSPASAPCSCRPLSHETLLWHHRLGHPSLPRLRDMASRTLVSGLPWSLPPLPLGPVPTSVPCVEGRQRAAPHSSTFPLTEAPQINLQPRVSLPETTPTLRWTRKVGDVSGFRVWGSRDFVRDSSANKLSSRADVTFDESVSYYRLFPYCSASLPSPPLFLAPGTPLVDPLPPQGPAPSGVAVEPAGAATRGAEPGGAELECVESGVAEPERVGPGGAEPERVEHGGAEPWGTAFGGAEPGGTASRGAEPARADSGGSQGWYARRCCRATGAAGAGAAGGAAGAGAAGGGAGAGAVGGFAGAGAARGAAGARAAGGAAGAGAPGGARTGRTGAAGAGGAAGVGAAGTGAGGAAGDVTGDPGAEGTGAVSAVTGGAARPRPYYVPLVQPVLGLLPSPGPTPTLLHPPPVHSQSQLQPASPLPSPSAYSGPTKGLMERREPESHQVSPESCPVSPESRSESPVRTVCAGHCVSRPRPPPDPSTHSMTLRPSTAPQRVPLPSPPASSLPDGPDPESDSLRAASPTVTRFLATAVTDPLFESTAASTLVAKLVDFAAACRLD